MTNEGVIHDFLQDGAAYLNALESGQRIEITQDTFDYFLNVLPPVYMRRTLVFGSEIRNAWFGFAEGCEQITAFWIEKCGSRTRYFCQRTDEVNRS
jgi:hypothetical protein